MQIFSEFELAESSWVFGLSKLSGALICVQMAYILAAQLRKDHPLGTKPLPWIGAWIWMAVGLVAIFPDLDWFQWMPLAFTFGLMFNSWMNGQVQYLPLLTLGQFISLLLAFSSDPFNFTDADLFSFSALTTGMTAMLWSTLHENGILYSNFKEETEKVDAFTMKGPESQEERENLNNQFELIGYLGLCGAFSVLWGLGTLIGALMLTRKVLLDGHYRVLVLAPLVHCLALYNMLNQLDILGDNLFPAIGLLLLVEGLGFILASIRNDAIYDYDGFEWKSDEDFFEFLDQIGLAGVASTIVGIFMLFSNTGMDTLSFTLTTFVLIGVGIQGYSPEFEARWRRVIGGYGSILMTFVTASTLNGIMENIGYMLGAIVTMGWIFMTSSMLGDENEIYQTQDSSEHVNNQQTVVNKVSDDEVVEVKDATIEEAVTTKTSSTALPALSIPKPVLKSSETRVKTRHGFEIELPPNMFENIVSSIEMTPHEGYKPVVSFGPRGEIMLNFEAI